MRSRRFRSSKASGFTLLELLVVVAIIAVLATLILGGLSAARRRTQVAVAKNNIAAIKAALQMYETDTGRYPRSASAASYKNDAHFVYAALRNRRTTALGGGPNSPYLDWKPEQVGWKVQSGEKGTFQDQDFGNATNMSGIPATPRYEPIGPEEAEKLSDASYQTQHTTGTNPLVFLDPWGNPYVYREWASIPNATKDPLVSSPRATTSNLGGSTSGDAHTDKPHDVNKFDIYSFGPNGVNEYGEGDDVTSWGDGK